MPALRFLMSRGEYRRAVTTFPSLTPVCLSSIATGAHPDVHEIPHLVWYHRGEQRLVEYGSSFGAVRAAGTTRTIRDVVFNLNEEHLSKKAVTVFEALEAAGRVTAAVNMVCYRGPARHAPLVPWLTRPAYGPTPFLLLQPVRVRRDRFAARSAHPCGRVGGRVREGRRPLARHARRLRLPRLLPPGLRLRLARVGPRRGARRARARGPRDRRRCSRPPAARTSSSSATRCSSARITGRRMSSAPCGLEDAFAGLTLFHRGNGRQAELAVTASNRAGMVYRLPGCRETIRASSPSASTAGATSSCSARTGPWSRGRTATSCASHRRRTAGRRAAPPRCSLSRMRSSGPGPRSRNPNAGDLVVSAAPGRRVRGSRWTRITSAAEATARWRRATPRCRCSRSEPARLRRGSSTSTPRVLDHFGVSA